MSPWHLIDTEMKLRNKMWKEECFSVKSEIAWLRQHGKECEREDARKREEIAVLQTDIQCYWEPKLVIVESPRDRNAFPSCFIRPRKSFVPPFPNDKVAEALPEKYDLFKRFGKGTEHENDRDYVHKTQEEIEDDARRAAERKQETFRLAKASGTIAGSGGVPPPPNAKVSVWYGDEQTPGAWFPATFKQVINGGTAVVQYYDTPGYDMRVPLVNVRYPPVVTPAHPEGTTPGALPDQGEGGNGDDLAVDLGAMSIQNSESQAHSPKA